MKALLLAATVAVTACSSATGSEKTLQWELVIFEDFKKVYGWYDGQAATVCTYTNPNMVREGMSKREMIKLPAWTCIDAEIRIVR